MVWWKISSHYPFWKYKSVNGCKCPTKNRTQGPLMHNYSWEFYIPPSAWELQLSWETYKISTAIYVPTVRTVPQSWASLSASLLCWKWTVSIVQDLWSLFLCGYTPNGLLMILRQKLVYSFFLSIFWKSTYCTWATLFIFNHQCWFLPYYGCCFILNPPYSVLWIPNGAQIANFESLMQTTLLFYKLIMLPIAAIRHKKVFKYKNLHIHCILQTH